MVAGRNWLGIHPIPRAVYRKVPLPPRNPHGVPHAYTPGGFTRQLWEDRWLLPPAPLGLHFDPVNGTVYGHADRLAPTRQLQIKATAAVDGHLQLNEDTCELFVTPVQVDEAQEALTVTWHEEEGASMELEYVHQSPAPGRLLPAIRVFVALLTALFAPYLFVYLFVWSFLAQVPSLRRGRWRMGEGLERQRRRRCLGTRVCHWPRNGHRH